MTSEIAVMNQRAIALAADSAVTLLDGGKTIVRNEHKKLFQFADDLPVGVMIFGAADLMGHPWDLLLEFSRAGTKPRPLPHLRDYADSFFARMDGQEIYFPPARQADEYKRLLASVFRFIMCCAHHLHEAGAESSDDAILGKAINLVWNRYKTYPDGRPRKDLACFPAGFAVTVEKDYREVIADLIAASFGAFALDQRAGEQLHDIALFCVVKDLFLEDVTGLVFGGFGADEPYPSVTTYHASAVVGGIVKRARIEETTIDGDLHAAVSLYGEADAAYALLRGIAPDLEARVYGTFHKMGRDLVDGVVDSFGNIDPAARESVRRACQSERVPLAVQDCYDSINAFQQEAYVDPVLAVVEISSRQELAETACALVELEIFKQRIAGQDPTAGGAVDVAVISRDAGFSWWKRQGA